MNRRSATHQLSKEQAAKELEELAQEIVNHNQAYEDGKPKIEDWQYDELRRRVALLEKRFPQLQHHKDALAAIGAPPSKSFQSIVHPSPMLSLDNAHTEDDMRQFEQSIGRFLKTDESFAYFCEAKIDGLSVNLFYKNGVYHKGATRGDGTRGEDVSANIATITTIPPRIDDAAVPAQMEIRGEVYMTYEIFDQLKKDHDFANARNAAVGSLRQQDSCVTRERKLSFFAHGATGLHSKSQEQMMNQLARWGFPIHPHNKLCHDHEAVVAHYQQLMAIRQSSLNHDIDGMVVKVNDGGYQERLGVGTRAPRWAIAWKFPARRATTQLHKVIWQVGRHGTLTPVAHLEGVMVGGVTVQRASLHNMDEIGRLELHHGDTVIVERAGDVIPKVIGVETEKRAHNTKPVVPPKKCPSCRRRVAKRDDDQVLFYCRRSWRCKDQVLARLQHCVHRDCFDIASLGSKRIQQFYDDKTIRWRAWHDVFRLKKHEKYLLKKEGWGEQSVSQLLTEIETARAVSLPRFLYALGIADVGERSSQLLARLIEKKKINKSKLLAMITKVLLVMIKLLVRLIEKKEPHKSKLLALMRKALLVMMRKVLLVMIKLLVHLIEKRESHKSKLLALMRKADFVQEIEATHGLGGVMANAWRAFFRDRKQYAMVKKLLKEVTIRYEEASHDGSRVLEGLRLVFTGTLSMSRQEAKALAERHGAFVMSDVSANVNYVIAGDKAGGKRKKAEELNIIVLDEQGFHQLLTGERISQQGSLFASLSDEA